jgi:hypothetical protein
MTTAYTSLLGLALPVTGELSGTWGQIVNDSITSLLDTSVAGTTNVSTDTDVTLTTTTGAANTARQAILLFSGARTALRTVTAPAQSKIYTVINATTGGFSVKLVGAGPTTGVTIANGARTVVAWNGSDFVEVSSPSSIILPGGTANGVLYLNGSKVVTSGSALTFDGTDFGVSGGNARINKNSNTTILTLGGSPSANWEGDIQFVTSNTETNWRVASNRSTAGSFTITPSTAGGGSTFTTPAINLSSSGNLGLGVTPSAWGSGSSAFQNTAGSIWRFGTDNIYFGQNYYFNGTNRIYSTTNNATEYQQGNGLHRWYVAPSGTAGNAITFTQAMTLSSAGELFLGATSAAFAEKLRMSGNYAVFENGTYTGFIGSGSSLGTGTGSDFAIRSSNALAFLTGGGTERARIDSSGNLLVGTTASAGNAGIQIIPNNGNCLQSIDHITGTATGNFYMTFNFNGSSIGSVTQSGTTAVLYNTTSDQRLKENIQDAESASSLIDSLQVRQFDWKSDNSHQRYGFVAQELVTVAPEAVHQPLNEEDMMAVDYSKLVPMLVKEIQSLRKRLADAGI